MKITNRILGLRIHIGRHKRYRDFYGNMLDNVEDCTTTETFTKYQAILAKYAAHNECLNEMKLELFELEATSK